MQTYIRDQEIFELTKQRKILEQMEKKEQECEKKLKEPHISKGSIKLYKRVDRYQQASSPVE